MSKIPTIKMFQLQEAGAAAVQSKTRESLYLSTACKDLLVILHPSPSFEESTALTICFDLFPGNVYDSM